MHSFLHKECIVHFYPYNRLTADNLMVIACVKAEAVPVLKAALTHASPSGIKQTSGVRIKKAGDLCDWIYINRIFARKVEATITKWK